MLLLQLTELNRKFDWPEMTYIMLTRLRRILDDFQSAASVSGSTHIRESPYAAAARIARQHRISICRQKKTARLTGFVSTSGKKDLKAYDKWELVLCRSCKALLWNAEAIKGQTNRENKEFTLCCQRGRVRLPNVREPPSPLLELLESPRFRPHIRVANSMLAFTSMGAQVIHRIGSLLPEDGNDPEYLQLYIFDADNEVENRKRAFTNGTSSLALEDSTIVYQSTNKGRQYDLPTASEIVGLVVGDLSATSVGRDIVVELKSSALQRIGPKASTVKREFMTMQEFYAYQLQTRPSEGMTIIKGGRLLHQYIVDAYVATDTERLCLLLKPAMQTQPRLAKRSFCHRPSLLDLGTWLKKYQDAMAICRWYGNPHLFITITDNPNWVELNDHRSAYGGDSPNSRPDLECRIFKLKLDEMMADLKKGVFFPEPDAEHSHNS
ncbi:hypothetical protein N665_0420s0015 [Sinapis alba]|nr:hypothetical protein N665_0420s0015 [Sinapis alba]